jgi:hypothetical protein
LQVTPKHETLWPPISPQHQRESNRITWMFTLLCNPSTPAGNLYHTLLMPVSPQWLIYDHDA